MKVRAWEEVAKHSTSPSVKVVLGNTGVSDLPEHVLRAVGDAAAKVLENFRREGTACGHQQWAETGFCATMICEQYVGRQRREGVVQ